VVRLDDVAKNGNQLLHVDMDKTDPEVVKAMLPFITGLDANGKKVQMINDIQGQFSVHLLKDLGLRKMTTQVYIGTTADENNGVKRIFKLDDPFQNTLLADLAAKGRRGDYLFVNPNRVDLGAELNALINAIPDANVSNSRENSFLKALAPKNPVFSQGSTIDE